MPHQLLAGWISNNLQLANTLPQNLPRIQCVNQRFVFQCIGIDEGSKKMIFGYHIDSTTNIIKIRSWCKSDSEGYWRCFLGMCIDQGSSHTRLMKGAEYCGSPELQRQTEMGYVYETTTKIELNNTLDMFWINEIQKLDTYSELTEMHLYDFICENYPHLLITDDALIEYKFLTDEAISTHSMLATEYAQEHINSIVPFPAGILPESIEYLKDVNNIDFQLEYESVTLPPGPIEQRVGIGHIIKQDIRLWQWIVNCLNDQIDVYSWHHSLLNQVCTTHRYKLYYPLQQLEAENFQYPKKDVIVRERPYLIIEISHTNEAQRFTYAAGETVETVYCWVNNVYFSNAPVTSFGNYNNTPINFSFLVQKPIDYMKHSVSQYYLQKQLNIFDFSSPDIIDHAYVQTALLNEALNPLIKEFKKLYNFPLFRNKYGTRATKEHHLSTTVSGFSASSSVSPPSPTSFSPSSQGFKTPTGPSPLSPFSQSFKTPTGPSPLTPVSQSNFPTFPPRLFPESPLMPISFGQSKRKAN